MTHRRVAGVLLAAGEARRLGRPKQLLEWQGETLITRAARTALDAGLDPVIAVIGSRAEMMRDALSALPAIVIENPRWPDGMSTSMQAGLSALPETVGAVVMLLVDQPRVEAHHLRAIVAAYEAGHPIVSLAFQGRRGSPTLFDRSLFDALMQIRGDEGGRSVVRDNAHLLGLVEVEDERIMLDVDTLEDWQQAISHDR